MDLNENADDEDRKYRDPHFGKLLKQVRILGTHVLRVATEDRKCAIWKLVNLSSFPIVLVFAREPFPFKAVQNLSDRLRRLGQHGLQGDT